MLDIDLFKSVNDNFGHDGGDKLLVELVKACSKSLRDIDLLARYGGEEFIILLPNTQEQDALSAAERIRTLVEQTSIIHKKQKINATISIGVSKVISDDSSHEEVIKRADIALYQAKNSGRNKVVIV
jgi:diguanylate cyclase (GGDEF)-like protein